MRPRRCLKISMSPGAKTCSGARRFSGRASFRREAVGKRPGVPKSWSVKSTRLSRGGRLRRPHSEAPRRLLPTREGGSAFRAGTSRRALEPLGDAELDERLPGHAEPPGLAVERLDHPRGKIDVDALERELGRCALSQATSPDTSSPASNFLSNSRAFIGLDLTLRGSSNRTIRGLLRNIAPRGHARSLLPFGTRSGEGPGMRAPADVVGRVIARREAPRQSRGS